MVLVVASLKDNYLKAGSSTQNKPGGIWYSMNVPCYWIILTEQDCCKSPLDLLCYHQILGIRKYLSLASSITIRGYEHCGSSTFFSTVCARL